MRINVPPTQLERPPAFRDGYGLGWETDYVVSVCLTPPRTIHPPHQISKILEESVIVLRRFQTHYDNIVSLDYYMVLFKAHPNGSAAWTSECPVQTDSAPRSVVEPGECGCRAPVCRSDDVLQGHTHHSGLRGGGRSSRMS